MRSWLGSIALRKKAAPSLVVDQPVFAAVIEPILRDRCLVCHGPEKQKAQLRLDTFEAIMRGGQNGPVLKPGSSKDSSLVQRMLLPLEADGHMPPEDQPQATHDETAILEWWINARAPIKVGSEVSKLKPELRHYLEAIAANPRPHP